MQTDAADIVIVTYNNSDEIVDLFDGIEAQGSRVNSVTVVDNGSSDGTAGALRSHRKRLSIELTILEAENHGFARGINTGAKDLDGRRPVLCLNPDVRLAPGVLEALLRVMSQDETVGVATAPLVGTDGEPDTASIRKHPTLGAASLYAVLGRLLPARLRYNSPQLETVGGASAGTTNGTESTVIDATTGALMLINPTFKNPRSGLFDEDYWMYGEDLQLCRDAVSSNFTVNMVRTHESLHVKGVSSGVPRKLKSNIAFHKAMWIYYRKNLSSTVVVDAGVYSAVHLKLALSASASGIRRATRKIPRRDG